jgi:hypothetical protein
MNITLAILVSLAASYNKNYANNDENELKNKDVDENKNKNKNKDYSIDGSPTIAE